MVGSGEHPADNLNLNWGDDHAHLLNTGVSTQVITLPPADSSLASLEVVHGLNADGVGGDHSDLGGDRTGRTEHQSQETATHVDTLRVSDDSPSVWPAERCGSACISRPPRPDRPSCPGRVRSRGAMPPATPRRLRYSVWWPAAGCSVAVGGPTLRGGRWA